MKQTEWLECRELDVMLDYLRVLDFLRVPVFDRKMRLFQIACCRRVWDALPTDAYREAVLVAERYADGQASEKERIEARKRLGEVGAYASRLEFSASYSVFYTLEESAILQGPILGCTSVAGLVAEDAAGGNMDAHQKGSEAEEAAEIALLRCIFGIPFKDTVLNSTWKTSDVIVLAKQMYEAREFSAMPILADALQDAGCDNTDILDHCRGPGPHVRGCWVVDLVLGKT